MNTDTPIDWDDAFANMAYAPGAEKLPAVWTEAAARFRSNGVHVSEHAYGSGPRAQFDLFAPEGTPKGLAVFVHGGYWMKFDKSYWSHFAQGALRRGWSVCMPSYTLAPGAQIADMTQEIGAAIRLAASKIEGPIRLSGHSAGGHLVSRMLCADTPIPDVLGRVAHTLSISGVHDLRPLLWTKLNDTLGLDAISAAAESPVLHMPNGTPHVTAWVGGGERPEFIRQSELFTSVWRSLNAQMHLKIDGIHNHFTVIEGLCDPDSPITRALTGD